MSLNYDQVSNSLLLFVVFLLIWAFHCTLLYSNSKNVKMDTAKWMWPQHCMVTKGGSLVNPPGWRWLSHRDI